MSWNCPDAINERLNEFSAMKERLLKEFLEEEESILFWTYELDNNV